MFKWFSKKRRIVYNLYNSCENLKNYDQKLIHRIQSLTGITQRDFQKLYTAVIERFSEFLRKPNQPNNNSDLLTALERVIMALKSRQGYLLPLGADSETTFREREEWTYAVFIAALFKNITSNEKINLVKALMPHSGFAWLKRNKKLFADLENYLQKNDEKNVFYKIIGTIKTEKEKPKEQEKEDIGHEQTINLEENLEKSSPKNSKQIKALLPPDTVIQEIDLNGNSFTEDNCKNALQAKQPQKTQSASKTKLPKFSADGFFEWLKENINHQLISINATDDFVFGTNEGILIVIPKAIDRFLESEAKRLNISNDLIKLDERIMLTKEIKKHKSLIRDSQNSRIHSYCIGRWENRQMLSGVMISPKALGADLFIPINSLLSIDPIGNS